jgi:hypothetical protein
MCQVVSGLGAVSRGVDEKQHVRHE